MRLMEVRAFSRARAVAQANDHHHQSNPAESIPTTGSVQSVRCMEVHAAKALRSQHCDRMAKNKLLINKHNMKGYNYKFLRQTLQRPKVKTSSAILEAVEAVRPVSYII